jgi:Tfp pilus assembly protein PilF
MKTSPRGPVISLLCAVVVVTLALMAFACSVDEGVSTTTAGSGTTTTASATGGTTSTQAVATSNTTIVVGGKTAEEYAAEIGDLQKAVDANPADLDALQALAVAQYNTQAYEDAAATYQKMLQLEDSALTRNNYANVLRDWGKADEAKAEYEKALSADPTLTVAYINLAGVYLREKNTAEAFKVLDRGIAATIGEDRTRLTNYKEQLNATTTTT